MNVLWMKCSDGNWCGLESLRLASVGVVCGVYVIWHEGNWNAPARTVRVGQGISVGSRLSAHRNDRQVTQYGAIGKLRVTWASVPRANLDRVERFLGDSLRPLVGSAFPDVPPLPVNHPW